MLVELAGRDVPGPGLVASGGSGVEDVGDAFGGVVAELAGADAAVVVQATGDVVELGLECGAALVALAGVGKASFDFADAGLDRLDVSGVGGDRLGEVPDRVLGRRDL